MSDNASDDPFGDDPFGDGVEFVENPEPRCPCVLLLETSSADLAGAQESAAAGLRSLQRDLLADELASKRVELAVVTYGPTRVARDFEGVEGAELRLAGATGGDEVPLGEAVEMAVEMVEERKQAYRRHGVAHYRPWILLVSSGRATDAWDNAAELVRSGEARGSFTFRTIALPGADTEVLSLLSEREVRELDGLRFQELFSWLGQSLSAVSRSSVGTEVDLPEPVGWAVV